MPGAGETSINATPLGLNCPTAACVHFVSFCKELDKRREGGGGVAGAVEGEGRTLCWGFDRGYVLPL